MNFEPGLDRSAALAGHHERLLRLRRFAASASATAVSLLYRPIKTGMSNKIVFNPYTQLVRYHDKPDEWHFLSPIPGKGLQDLVLARSKYPRLYGLLEEIGGAGLALIDIDNDLDLEDRILLGDHGVLVDAGSKPNKTLFSCHINSVEEFVDDPPDDLMVNPTMLFEGFDLAKFRSWAGERNLSPYLPSVWITDTTTGLRSGYWLESGQAIDVGRLTPGEAPILDLEPTLRSKLLAAQVIVSASRFELKNRETRIRVAETSQSFLSAGYSIFRNVIPKAQIGALQNFYREFEREGFMTLGDGQVARRFVAPREPLAGTIHQDLAELICKIAGVPVKPTYCYVASYLEGASLSPHVDRPQCEYSFSLQVDYQPEQHGGISPWPLYFSDTERSYERSANLSNGDCVAYKGCDLVHYRNELPPGHRSTSLFLHYVPASFQGSLD